MCLFVCLFVFYTCFELIDLIWLICSRYRSCSCFCSAPTIVSSSYLALCHLVLWLFLAVFISHTLTKSVRNKSVKVKGVRVCVCVWESFCLPAVFISYFSYTIYEKFFKWQCNSFCLFGWQLFLANGHRIFNCFVALRVKFLCGFVQLRTK